MKMLALDTSTRTAAIAVVDGDCVLASAQLVVSTHAETLLQEVDRCLRLACIERLTDLDAIVCGQGPGSFTGVRIGLATAKGLCLASGRPLRCVSSLLALALGAQDCSSAEDVVVPIIDARRDQVYFAPYRNGRELSAPAAESAEDLRRRLEAYDRPILVGNGAERFGEILTAGNAVLAPEPYHQIRAETLAWAAAAEARAGVPGCNLATAVPLYVRGPDIREPAARS
jgi:tRNA threonylcarbamoyladenosine biosynthesis protein TsaB